MCLIFNDDSSSIRTHIRGSEPKVVDLEQRFIRIKLLKDCVLTYSRKRVVIVVSDLETIGSKSVNDFVAKVSRNP